jgi:hypothetical protein
VAALSRYRWWRQSDTAVLSTFTVALAVVGFALANAFIAFDTQALPVPRKWIDRYEEYEELPPVHLIPTALPPVETAQLPRYVVTVLEVGAVASWVTGPSESPSPAPSPAPRVSAPRRR